MLTQIKTDDDTEGREEGKTNKTDKVLLTVLRTVEEKNRLSALSEPE